MLTLFTTSLALISAISSRITKPFSLSVLPLSTKSTITSESSYQRCQLHRTVELYHLYGLASFVFKVFPCNFRDTWWQPFVGKLVACRSTLLVLLQPSCRLQIQGLKLHINACLLLKGYPFLQFLNPQRRIPHKLEHHWALQEKILFYFFHLQNKLPG